VPGMRIYTEESFGPVVSVIRARGIDEAVRLANDTEYGLAAAVFGRDVARALTVAQRIESGICHINGPTVHDEAQMPFGGVKGSGYGRFGGQAGIAEFTDLRWITIETQPQHYPFLLRPIAKPPRISANELQNPDGSGSDARCASLLRRRPCVRQSGLDGARFSRRLA